MTTYRQNDRFTTRTIRGECILIPVMNSEQALDCLYTLNPTARVIWESAGEGLDEDAVAERLVGTFKVESATARDDTQRVLDELCKLGALEER